MFIQIFIDLVSTCEWVLQKFAEQHGKIIWPHSRATATASPPPPEFSACLSSLKSTAHCLLLVLLIIQLMDIRSFIVISSHSATES